MFPVTEVQTTAVPDRVNVPVAVDPTGVTDCPLVVYPLLFAIWVMSERILLVAATGAAFERTMLMPSAFRLWTFSDRS
jgi:hypothetical protein